MPPPQVNDPSPRPVPLGHITAVVVLYGQAPAESAALRSLLLAVDAVSGSAERLSLVIHDNSLKAPVPPPSLGLPVHYVHEGANRGLAHPYNAALQKACSEGSTWLLLLDQDTVVSREYLEELLTTTATVEHDAQVAAVVPKLWAGSRLYSPDAPFLWQIRRQLAGRHYAIDAAISGKQEEEWTAYNSGAALRVSVLIETGGFPEDYWLDYLDHAVFVQLHRRGYRMWVMHTILRQNLSHMDLNSVPLWRHWSVLAAQTRFVLQFGNSADRLFFRWWLLKTSRAYFHSCDDERVWRLRALQAFRMRLLAPRYPEGSDD
jgi:GT2 family glycosyltransferase